MADDSPNSVITLVARVRIHKAFKYRIYPTPAQEARLVAWSNALRWLWNLAHEHRLLGLSMSKKRYPSAYEQMRGLTELRRELPWLRDVPVNVCGNLLVKLDTAWRHCFSRVCGQPRWKRSGRDQVNLTETHSATWRLGLTGVIFPKLGELRTVMHRPLEGKRRSCTILRDGDQWFASIVCEVELPDPTPRVSPVVAIDRGVTAVFADSDGGLTPNPKFHERAMKRLARAQRIVSRRKKGSKNREKAKLRVMRLQRKVRRQREYFLHVESARYTKSHGVVVLEKLNVAGMSRNRRLSRSIADAGWSRFAEMLRYKLGRSGGSLVEVPAQYSSQTCSECGTVDAASRVREHFSCTGCGHTDNADLNAAKVLLTRANRSGLPVEGTALEATRRSRKEGVLYGT